MLQVLLSKTIQVTLSKQMTDEYNEDRSNLQILPFDELYILGLYHFCYPMLLFKQRQCPTIGTYGHNCNRYTEGCYKLKKKIHAQIHH